MRLAKDVGAELKILPLSVLEVPKVAENPENRCYYCKRAIFSALIAAAAADGYDLILDGTNASDPVSDRPGMEALRELSVRSPLRECGLTKSEIRELSRQAGLFTWDKPAYACLATRVPAGEAITAEKLEKTEKAEDFLRSLGTSSIIGERWRAAFTTTGCSSSPWQWLNLRIRSMKSPIPAPEKCCWLTGWTTGNF